MLDLTVLITFNTILNLENVIFYFHEIFVLVKKFVMKHLIYEDKPGRRKLTQTVRAKKFMRTFV